MKFHALRHGHSIANEMSLIVSDPASGRDGYGLSERGRREVSKSARDLRGTVMVSRIFCSEFLRARETANIAAKILSLPDPVVLPELNERFFGILEGQSDLRYREAWELDLDNPDTALPQAESVTRVLSRMREALRMIESLAEGESPLIVSHGDPLNILRCSLAGKNPGGHRNAFVPLRTAEWIQLPG